MPLRDMLQRAKHSGPTPGGDRDNPSLDRNITTHRQLTPAIPTFRREEQAAVTGCADRGAASRVTARCYS
jgi:hypothetical protein